MKKILLGLGILISLAGFSQSNYTTVNMRYIHTALAPGTLHAPAGVTPALGTGAWLRSGGLFVDTVGGGRGLQYYLNGNWIRVYDTTDALLEASDTSAMLSEYLRGATEGWGINISGSQHKTWTVDSLEAASWYHLYKVADSLAAVLGGGTPTLQQVVDAGNSLNNQSILLGGTGGSGYIQWDNDDDADFVNQFNQGNTDISFTTSSTGDGPKLSWTSLTALRTFEFPDVSSTLVVTGFANSWGDGIKQTFNPDGTNSGLNVGSHTADPSAPANGDIFYNSTSNTLRARINGAWVSLGAGSGTVTSVDDGWGMNFTSITTTGDVIADSLVLTQWARLYKVVDSLASAGWDTGVGDGDGIYGGSGSLPSDVVVTQGSNYIEFTGPKFGIGTTTFTDPLSSTVNFVSQQSGHRFSHSSNIVWLTNSGGEQIAMYGGSGSNHIGSFSNHPFTLQTNNTDRLTIATSGNIYTPGKISNVNPNSDLSTGFDTDWLGSAVYFRFADPVYAAINRNSRGLTYSVQDRLIMVAPVYFDTDSLVGIAFGVNNHNAEQVPTAYSASGNYSNHNYWLKTNNEYRVLVDSAGDVGIGTPFAYPSADYVPKGKLHVRDSANHDFGRNVLYVNSESKFDLLTVDENNAALYIKNQGQRVSGANNLTNYGILMETVENGQVNYAMGIGAGAGNSGFGTLTPTDLVHINGNLQLGTAGSTKGVMKISGNTSGTVTIQPAAAAGTYTLTLPTTDGGANEYLQTDGSGNLTWAAGSSGITVGTTTITSGTNTRILYNNAGVVGEYTVTGSGTTVPLSTSPDFTTGITIGSVAVPTISSTHTLTNKRWTSRVGSTTSSGTPTINTDNVDIFKITAQAEDITSMTTNLSGTPVDGDVLVIEVTGTAARAITWGASFVSTTVTLPTTTSSTTTLTVVLMYYTTSSYGNNKWHCVNYY